MKVDGFRKNKFVSGGMNWDTKHRGLTFTSYLMECLDGDINYVYRDVKKKLNLLGIKTINADRVCTMDNNDMEELENIKSEVKKNREFWDTYRGDLQCNAEAELVLMSRSEGIVFLTPIKNLLRLSHGRIKHWSPEVLYRFFCVRQLAKS